MSKQQFLERILSEFGLNPALVVGDKKLFFIFSLLIVESGLMTQAEIINLLKAGDLSLFEAVAGPAWANWQED